jgi:hypothetical protein
MKAAFSLLLLFVSWPSIADTVRIDPIYIDDATYFETDEAAIIQIQAPLANAAPCTRHTAVGVPCVCNRGIFRGRNAIGPGWHLDERMHAIRDGWRVSYFKGTHLGVCYRDR